MIAIAALALALSLCLCQEATAQTSFDYCQIHCPTGGNHILCDKSKSEFMSNVCKDYQSGLSADEKALVLDTLNKKRSRVATGKESINTQPPAADMLELLWDPELEATAQGYAKECMTMIKDECRLLYDGTRYQQIIDDDHMPTPKGNPRQLTLAMVLQKWYEGVLSFKPSEIPAQGDRLYVDVKDKYAQVVWSKTARVGCGYIDATLDNGKLYAYRMVCNFSPPGNVNGEAVYEEGAPASACPYGYRASLSYTGLCEEGV